MKHNVIKGVITSIIGVVTMLLTLMLLFIGAIDFVWSGIGGLCIGTVLLLSPDTIVKKFGVFLKSIGKDDDDSYTPPPSNNKIDNPDDN